MRNISVSTAVHVKKNNFQCFNSLPIQLMKIQKETVKVLYLL